MPPKIRLASMEDVPAMCEMWIQLMNFHSDLNKVFRIKESAVISFQKFLESHILGTDGEKIALVASLDNKIVGYAMGNVHSKPSIFALEKIGYISDMYVSPNARNQKIGTLLVKELENRLKSLKITRIELNISPQNPISPHFWNKMGYMPYVFIMGKNLN